MWARTSLLLEELPSQLAALYLDVDLYKNTMVPRGPDGYLDFEGMEALDTVWERPNYKDLQILSLTLRSMGSPDDIAVAQDGEFIKQKLSKLHARRPKAIQVHLL